MFSKVIIPIMKNTKLKCNYCNQPIKGYVETSKQNSKIKLCSTCYCIEMFELAMAKIIKESENK